VQGHTTRKQQDGRRAAPRPTKNQPAILEGAAMGVRTKNCMFIQITEQWRQTLCSRPFPVQKRCIALSTTTTATALYRHKE